MKIPVRTCRACGCTDEDCSGCIQRVGSPCHWVEEDLCSHCQELGYNTLIRIKRGNDNVATARVGNKTYRASSTACDMFAAQRLAEKICVAVRATAVRVERLTYLSIKDSRAGLYLEFK